MSTFKKIYFIGIGLVALTVIAIYMINERDHRREMEKIRRLEAKIEKEKRDLEHVRSQTDPCPVTGLTDPRSCYLQSNYRCSWNELGKRCDLKY